MSEPGTAVHLKVKICNESLWVSSPTDAQVCIGKCVRLRTGGSGEAATTEKGFFMSHAYGWKRSPCLVCPGTEIWTPAQHQVQIENPQKGMFPSWMMEEEKKLNGRPSESWKALIQFLKKNLQSSQRRGFSGGPDVCTAQTQARECLLSAHYGEAFGRWADTLRATQGEQKVCPFLTRGLFHLLFPVKKAFPNPLNI